METATLFASSKSRWTDNELMALPNDGRKYELIDGYLLMSPVREHHSWICINIVYLLTDFVRRKKLGRVYDSSLGCRLTPEVMLSPDVSFVSKARLRQIRVSPEKFLQGAPDFVVEVLSRGDHRRIIEGKLDKYFEHGAKLAWVVDPKGQAVTVHEPDKVTSVNGLDSTLTAGNLLPGFSCKLREIFLDD
jgi:Uma2 family endonuclease